MVAFALVLVHAFHSGSDLWKNWLMYRQVKSIRMEIVSNVTICTEICMTLHLASQHVASHFFGWGITAPPNILLIGWLMEVLSWSNGLPWTQGPCTVRQCKGLIQVDSTLHLLLIFFLSPPFYFIASLTKPAPMVI